MRWCLSGLLLCAFLVTAAQAGEKDVLDRKADQLGFWDLGLSRFAADEPLVIKSPVAQEGAEYYYVWPFRFKYTVSLRRVVKLLEDQLEEEEDRSRRSSLQLILNTAKQDLEHGSRDIRLHISLHTDTGKVYHDLANPVIRNMAERHTGGRYYTTQELRTARIEEDEMVDAVAIFPQIDVNCDRFEVRVLGLGRRVQPTYYPGHLLKEGLRANAKLRRAIRYFYERLGDPLHREIDRIREIDNRGEWLWLWSTDIYPLESDSFIVKRSQGLEYEYRFFPYEVFNSTAQDRRMEVLEAGLAPRVRWHGIALTLAMLEDVRNHDFWQKQAVSTLRQTHGHLFPGEGQHVNGEVPAGKLRKGVTVVRWGVENAEDLLREVSAKLRVMGLTAGDGDADNPLVQAYVEAGDLSGEAKWRRQPLPSEEEVRSIILAQCRKEMEQRAIDLTEADERRYGELAPFALLLNALADDEIRRQQNIRRVPVYYTVSTADIVDSARFEKLYAAGRPTEREKELVVEITDPEEIEGAVGLGGTSGPSTTTGDGPGTSTTQETPDEPEESPEVIEELW